MTYTIRDTITEAELKTNVREIFVPLYHKDGCTLYARLLSGTQYVYVLKIKGGEDYWTCNESQAVEVFNAVRVNRWKREVKKAS